MTRSLNLGSSRSSTKVQSSLSKNSVNERNNTSSSTSGSMNTANKDASTIISKRFLRNVLRCNANQRYCRRFKIRDFTMYDKVVEAGSNYGSKVARLTVEYESDKCILAKKLFLKILFQGPFYDSMKAAGMLRNETIMYKTVLPWMQSTLGQRLAPVSFHSAHPEIIVLEDLVETGFQMASRSQQLDFEHAVHALKALAKFHGCSVKMKEAMPEVILNLLSTKVYVSPEDYHRQTKDGFLIMNLDCLSKLIKATSKTPHLRKYTTRLAALKQSMHKVIGAVPLQDVSRFQVLNHGDFWINNMLFKYNSKLKITSVRLIDFQMCRWGCAALDLVHFFVSSVKCSVFEFRHDDMLQEYLESLNTTMRQVGCTIPNNGVGYTLEDAKTAMRDLLLYSISIISCYLPIITASPEDASEFYAKSKNCFNPPKKLYYGERYLNCVSFWLSYLERVGAL